MHEQILIEIGLTKSEIAVYFALLQLGSTTTGPVIKQAGIASGKAYLILNKLSQKGLVTHAIISGTKQYQAKDPERLLDYVQEKEQELHQKHEQLKSIIPKLKADYAEHAPPKAELYEGLKGFKTFYEWVLKECKSEDTVEIMGVPREANDKFGAYLLDWNVRRIGLGISMRIIYNHDAKIFGKKREKMELTEVRYMKKKLETPAWIDIFQNYVATINVHTSPIVFLIKNKESAHSYRQYFSYIWKQSSITV